MFDITKFHEYREDNRFEVKKAKNGLPNSLWETYSSFANCYGGVIILGVEENKDGSWTATGLQDSAKLLKEFWDLINNKEKVNLNLLRDDDVEIYEEQGNIIMVIHVPKAARELKPIYINHDMFTGTYRRNWEGDYVCSKSEILGMLRDQPEDTMDMKVLDHMEVDELNMETLRAYRNRHMALKPHHPWEKLSAHDYLEMIGAASKSKTDHKLHPTAAGLLMFGEEYQIVREYPEYFLDYREVLDPTIRWTDRFHSSSGEWTGNIFEFYFRVYNKLSKDIKVPFKIEDGTRIDDTPVHKALREALANCLINCDYFGTCGIVIKKETDRIIMENPGVIRPGKHQMLRGGLSDPRNKALMKMFNMINIGERAGSGVPDIYYVWHNEGWEAPVIEERYHPDRTILTLPITKTIYVETVNKKPAIKTGDKKPAIKTGDKKINAKTKEHINLLLNCMEENKIYDLVTICDLINLKPSRTKEIVKLMINMEMIQPIGNSNKNRRYRKIV